MFEKRVIPGKTYCVTAYCPIIVSSVLNNTEVILVDTSEPGQYFFVAPTTSINSSISPNYILEVKGGGASDSGNSGSGSGVGISFEKVIDFDSLPETGQLGTIYLVPNEDADNQWTEYVYIDDRYEIIGSKEFTTPDLENYAKLNADNNFTGRITVPELIVTDNLTTTGSGYTGYTVFTLFNGAIVLQNNTIYRGEELTSLLFLIPDEIPTDFICEFAFTSGINKTTFFTSNTIHWVGDDIVDGTLSPEPNTRYSGFIYYDGAILRGTVLAYRL